MSSGLAFYRGGTRLLAPFARLYLELRARGGREDASRLEERFGLTNLLRPQEPLVWLHGASIGEALATLPLISTLTQRGFAVLVTTGTRTSAALLRARLPPRAFHQYAPLDLPGAVNTFLDHWRPDLLLLVESEIWPNILHACAKRRVPVALINARISERSFMRWRRAPCLSRALFGSLAVCIAQSPEQATRFATLGARDVVVVGNLKFDAAPPPVDADELARWREIVGFSRVFVAASTHPGDEALLLDTHTTLRASMPDLLSIIVPRHPARGTAILSLARQRGLNAGLRSSSAMIDRKSDALIADTIGEMGLWLRLATVAVIGKTFGNGGGQTPIEAALCGVPVLHGPSTHQFEDAFAALDRSGGACTVTAASFPTDLAILLDDPARRRDMGRSAAKAIALLAGGTQKTLDVLETLLTAALMKSSRS